MKLYNTLIKGIAMNKLSQHDEETLLTLSASTKKIDSTKEANKTTVTTVKTVKVPLMKYFDLLDDASPNYVLGYN